jgi:hypothetical protein
MAIFSNKIVEAKFLDASNTIIEVLYQDSDSIISHALEIDLENQDFHDLMEEHTLEDIEKYTNSKRKKALENYRKKIDEEVESKIKDSVQSDVPMTVANIFDELIDKRNDMNFLFQFKAAVFKNKEVISSKADETKKQIRKSKDLFEVVELLKDIM